MCDALPRNAQKDHTVVNSTKRWIDSLRAKERPQQGKFLNHTPGYDHCTPSPKGEWTQSSPLYTEEDRAARSVHYHRCKATNRFGEQCRRNVLNIYGDYCGTHRDVSEEEELYLDTLRDAENDTPYGAARARFAASHASQEQLEAAEHAACIAREALAARNNAPPAVVAQQSVTDCESATTQEDTPCEALPVVWRSDYSRRITEEDVQRSDAPSDLSLKERYEFAKRFLDEQEKEQMTEAMNHGIARTLRTSW